MRNQGPLSSGKRGAKGQGEDRRKTPEKRDTEGPRQQQRRSTYPDKHTSLPLPLAAPTSHVCPRGNPRHSLSSLQREREVKELMHLNDQLG